MLVDVYNSPQSGIFRVKGGFQVEIVDAGHRLKVEYVLRTQATDERGYDMLRFFLGAAVLMVASSAGAFADTDEVNELAECYQTVGAKILAEAYNVSEEEVLPILLTNNDFVVGMKEAASQTMSSHTSGEDVKGYIDELSDIVPGGADGFYACYNELVASDEVSEEKVQSESATTDKNIREANFNLLCEGDITMEYHAISDAIKWLNSQNGEANDRVEEIKPVSFYLEVSDGVLADSDSYTFKGFKGEEIISLDEKYITIPGANPNNGARDFYRISRKTGKMGFAGSSDDVIATSYMTDGASGFYLQWIWQVNCKKNDSGF